MDYEFLVKWEKFCYYQHDVVVNQTYGGEVKLPYSFHLSAVKAHGLKFRYLLTNGTNSFNDEQTKAVAGCLGHDLQEDARLTYNDIKAESKSADIAEIIYLCSEERGRNRKERHSDKFYEEMATNELAVYVKLCDIMANSLFSLTTDSSMFDKMKVEYPQFKKFCYTARFKDMWDYLEGIYSLGE